MSIIRDAANGLIAGLTAPQFANDKDFATTEFVQRALGNAAIVDGIDSTTTLTAAHAGHAISLFGAAGGYTITLPLGSTLPAGATIEFFACWTGTLNCAILRQGSDTIAISANSVTGITLYPGNSVKFVWSGVQWMAIGESQLPWSPLFGAAFGQAGYQRLPSGLIWQWGNLAFKNVSAGYFVKVPVTFPVAYPNNVLAVMASPVVNDISYASAAADGLASNTTGTAITIMNNWQGSAQQIGAVWQAIGY